MTRHQEPKPFAKKVKEKLTLVFPPERLEALAQQSRFVQRASSKLTGADFFTLMTTDIARPSRGVLRRAVRHPPAAQSSGGHDAPSPPSTPQHPAGGGLYAGGLATGIT